MRRNSRILVTGGSGLLGTALASALSQQGYTSVISLSSKDQDLIRYEETVKAWCDIYRPEYVFHLAGSVFGLGGNLSQPAEIFLRNVLINTHVVEASLRAGVRKLVAMGSICAYPSPRAGMLRETDVFLGEPGTGERAYGQAKRALLAHLEACAGRMEFAFPLSTNLYGSNDRFNSENGHVVPSLIRKFFEAEQSGDVVQVWGDGSSSRDFMHAQDAAEALIVIMDRLEGRVNLATGRMTTIRELVGMLGQLSGVGDRVRFDTTKPKGHHFDGISVERLASIGFSPRRTLEEGLAETYRWYATHHGRVRT